MDRKSATRMEASSGNVEIIVQITIPESRVGAVMRGGGGGRVRIFTKKHREKNPFKSSLSKPET